MRVVKKLFVEAIAKFLLGVVLVGMLIFWPAGTLHFSRGWLLMAILFVPMFCAGIVMLIKNPMLLQSRLGAKEKAREQSAVVKLSGLMFIAGFVCAGLDYRNGWTQLPMSVSVIGTVLFLSAYLIYAEVLRENSYLSRTIEVQENQHVVDTGLYGIVRHPMYSATVLLFLSMPLVLGSLIAVIIFLLYIPIIVKRILHEEEFLAKELEGYDDYLKKVKYRLLPFIW